MKFSNNIEEKRIFERFKWCLKKLFNVDLNGIHLSEIDTFSPFDYKTQLIFNGWKKVGKTEIRYTTKDILDTSNCYISKDKKKKEIDYNNSTNDHRLFLSEHPEGLYVADLVRADWKGIGSSNFTKEVCFFDAVNTPNLIIPLRRGEEMNDKVLLELKEYIIKQYKTLNEARSILMHMTNR